MLRVSSVSSDPSGGKKADGITIAGSIIHAPLSTSLVRESCIKLVGLMSGRALDTGWRELDPALYGGGVSYTIRWFQDSEELRILTTRSSSTLSKVAFSGCILENDPRRQMRTRLELFSIGCRVPRQSAGEKTIDISSYNLLELVRRGAIQEQWYTNEMRSRDQSGFLTVLD